MTVERNKTPKFANFIASLSAEGTASLKNSSHFSMTVDGKNVGSASFDWKKPGELNLVWLGIDKKQRGQGYASAVFDAAVQYGKANGAKALTLEVPGKAPDARHIYEKQGFVAGKQISPSNDMWGGLTEMRLDLTKNSVRHSDDDRDMEIEKALSQTFAEMPDSVAEEVFGDDAVEHSEDPDVVVGKYIIEHYGIKGMKWGVRRPVGSDGLVKKTSAAAKAVGERAKAAKEKHEAGKGKNIAKSAKEMDLQELQDKVARLDLEKRYVKLSLELNQLQKSKFQKMFEESMDQQQKKLANDPAIAEAIALGVQKATRKIYRI